MATLQDLIQTTRVQNHTTDFHPLPQPVALYLEALLGHQSLSSKHLSLFTDCTLSTEAKDMLKVTVLSYIIA